MKRTETFIKQQSIEETIVQNETNIETKGYPMMTTESFFHDVLEVHKAIRTPTDTSLNHTIGERYARIKKYIQQVSLDPCLIKEEDQELYHMGEELFVTTERKLRTILINLWLETKENKNTARKYNKIIKNFISFCTSNNAHLMSNPPSIATLIHAWLDTKHWTDGTVSYNLSVLGTFYAFVVKIGMYDLNPITLLDRTRIPAYQQTKTIVSESVKEKAISLGEQSPFDAIQDEALMATLSIAGRRVSEITGLTLSGIEEKGNSYTLTFERTQKGKKGE